jgi:hypothetical protein
MELFQAKLVLNDLQAHYLFNPDMATKTLHELKNPSSIIEPIALAISFVKGLPDLGSSNGSILPW